MPPPATDRCAALPLLLALVVAGCGPVDADHPLDPATPVDQQQPSRIEGVLTLPGGVAPTVFIDAAAALYPSDDANEPAYTAAVDVAGRFRFDAVAPGLYRLSAATELLRTEPIILPIPPGQTLDLGPMALRPLLGELTGQVVDEAGAPVPDAPVRLRDDGTSTGPDGRFVLVGDAGPGELHVEAPGFAPRTRAVDLAPEAVTDLGTPIVLTASAGAASGRVTLRRFETAERLGRATVIVDDGPPVPLTDGMFTVLDLAPGRHLLEARAPGYDPRWVEFTVRADEVTALGAIELAHASTGPDAVWLDAWVLEGEAPAAGMAVDVLLDGLLAHRAITDRTGRLSVAAARDETYALRLDTPGFLPAEVGLLRWSEAEGAFVGGEGDAPVLRAEPEPQPEPDPEPEPEPDPPPENDPPPADEPPAP